MLLAIADVYQSALTTANLNIIALTLATLCYSYFGHCILVLSCRSCVRSQDSGEWRVSAREPGPSVRSLHGTWWNNEWQATKVLYARLPDGKRKASLCSFGVSDVCSCSGVLAMCIGASCTSATQVSSRHMRGAQAFLCGVP